MLITLKKIKFIYMCVCVFVCYITEALQFKKIKTL